jgi:hypothetical protein
MKCSNQVAKINVIKIVPRVHHAILERSVQIIRLNIFMIICDLMQNAGGKNSL